MPSPSSKKPYTHKHRGKVYPTLGASLWLHDRALELAGGLPGIKDEGALLSALEAPIRSAGGQDAYFTFFEKVTALGFLIARNHPFSDANKRTSLLLMKQTLEWNGYYPTWSDETQVMVVSLLGAGHLEMTGLRHALLLACELDAADTML
jgi:death on curing protein